MMEMQGKNAVLFAKIPDRQHGHQIVPHHDQGVGFFATQDPLQAQEGSPPPDPMITHRRGGDPLCLQNGLERPHLVEREDLHPMPQRDQPLGKKKRRLLHAAKIGALYQDQDIQLENAGMLM